MRFVKKILHRGEITVPTDLREMLGIEDGDFVEFAVVGIFKKGEKVRLGRAGSGIDVANAAPRRFQGTKPGTRKSKPPKHELETPASTKVSNLGDSVPA